MARAVGGIVAGCMGRGAAVVASLIGGVGWGAAIVAILIGCVGWGRTGTLIGCVGWRRAAVVGVLIGRVRSRRAAVVGVLIGCVACGRIGFASIETDGASADALDRAARCDRLVACGPMGNAPCCDSKPVPGGTFLRGYDVAADMMFADMTSPATVSSFRLDTYEVTVGRFRQFVEAGMGTQLSPPAPGAGAHGNIPNSGWDSAWNPSLAADTSALRAALQCNPSYYTWSDAPGNNEN